MRLNRLKNRLIAGLVGRFPQLGERLVAAYQPQEQGGEIPWVRPAKPLVESTLALVTTSGIHHGHQQPFDMVDPDGDPGYRTLDRASLLENWRITHDYYDHRNALKDPNIVFPLERLQEFETEGVLGQLASTHYSFMGHVDGRHIPTLINNGRAVARALQRDNVDLVFLTPA